MSTMTLSQELYEELQATPTVDAHEHLHAEADSVARQVDFYTLFECYCQADLVAAGATGEDFALWADRSRPLKTRWEHFKPFLSAIRTVGQARAALIVIRDLLGFDDLTDETVADVGRKLAEVNRPGVYDAILRRKCNLAACIVCFHADHQVLGEHGDLFYHLAAGRDVLNVHQVGEIAKLEQRHRRNIHTIEDLLDVMTLAVEAWRVDRRVVGIKINQAYQRRLDFAKRTRYEAEQVFNRLLTNEMHELAWHEARPLQDYLVYQLVARAEAVGLPIAIHTGLLGGNLGVVDNGSPLHLLPLITEFPRARFDLFHGGAPWVREIATLAKHFPGVHLNMTWLHLFNPAQARSALSEWLDMVPNTKIFGFGGDYIYWEKVLGHLTLARQNIARVLAEKVEEGAYSRSEASLLIRRLMLENPNEFYRLNLKGA